MIVPMLKYSFVLFHKDYPAFVKALRELGVAHVEVNSFEPDEELQEKISQQKNWKELLKKMQHLAPTKQSTIVKGHNEVELQKTFEELESQIAHLQVEHKHTERLIENLKPWGEFSPELLVRLAEGGVYPHFFSCPSKSFLSKWEEEYDVFKIREERSTIWFVLFHNAPDAPSINADKFPQLQKTATNYLNDLHNIEEEQKLLREKLYKLSVEGQTVIAHALKELEKEIECEHVLSGYESVAAGSAYMITAWFPQEYQGEVEVLADNQGAVLLRQETTDTDVPPVKLKNNRFARLFEPIGNIYTLPKYSELDLTPFFAPFFTLFFGFCFGDAGYGVLLLLPMIYLIAKGKPAMKKVGWLGLSLCLSAILFGVLTGTVFGILLAETPILPEIARYKEFFLDTDRLMVLSLALGAVQLLFGIFLKGINQIQQQGWKYSLSTFGWLLLFLSSVINYFVVNNSNGVLPFINAGYLSFASVAMLAIFLFNTPGKNPFVNIGIGLWDSYNMVVGTVGDLLSYMRLFALGLASGLLGNSFNQIAMMCGEIEVPIVNIIVMLLVLILGHSINIFMSILGSFVHPLRLTFVEFYKAVGFAGGGRAYSPFREQ